MLELAGGGKLIGSDAGVSSQRGIPRKWRNSDRSTRCIVGGEQALVEVGARRRSADHQQEQRREQIPQRTSHSILQGRFGVRHMRDVRSLFCILLLSRG